MNCKNAKRLKMLSYDIWYKKINFIQCEMCTYISKHNSDYILLAKFKLICTYSRICYTLKINLIQS